jgi:hypothetical protein
MTCEQENDEIAVPSSVRVKKGLHTRTMLRNSVEVECKDLLLAEIKSSLVFRVEVKDHRRYGLGS